ncbi:MAG: hypothetical protein A3E01_08885 [Gammaproteobacteria bacterium RIFCSPHIGHO2_12_FULL_63_22]|nr:MAG: hypothetical protein A3E01_08885 [Gammaproteobacteria bacterium RIFCSPHIGHO2_12_FULL_63_22]
MRCRICSNAADHAFNALLLFKYEAEFFYCETCGFLQTAEPHWLDEAYEDAVVAADTGVLQRNQSLATMSAILLYALFPSRSKFLDYAGGYGLFVRLMRDVGFDFYWSDKYCENVFAQGFESKPGETFELVTTFEVLEHVSDPLEFIRDVLAKSSATSLLFSTELFSGRPPDPNQWWYYCFEAGQHISFFQRRTLEALAAQLGRKLYSHGSVHLITSRSIPPILFRILTSRFLARALSFIPRLGMRSRTMADHERLIKQRR